VAKRSAKSRKTESRLVHEVEAILCSALGAALALSFYSYSPDSPATNQVGVVGYTVAHALVQCFGYASYLFPALLVAGAVGLFARQTATVSPVRLVGAVALLFEGAVFLGLYRQGVVPTEAGGWVGGFLSALARQAFGMVGSSVILAAFAGWIFIMLTGAAPSRVLARFALLARSAVLRAGTFMGEKIERAASGLGEFAREHRPRMPRMPTRPDSPAASSRSEQVKEPAAPMVFFMDDETDLDEADTDAIGLGVDEVAVDAASNGHAELEEGKARSILEITSSAESVAEARRRMSEESKGRDKQEKFNFSVDDNDYSLPPVNLLGDPDEADVDVDEDTLIALSKVLEQKLSTFGVSGSVTAVRSGPVITTYEFEPDAGIKVSRIVNLCDDLTMALRAHGVRIVAPIPGKNVVGIEVSNRHRDLVGLRDLIDCEEFRGLASALSVVVGRDTTGVARYADLAKMPHLLMAGATGSGKSVALNAIIMSILYKATPRDVRFIMIDPKMLELSIYEGIPHLLVPVVTDVRKAAAALANVMREMDRRFELMKELKVRSVDDYNTRVAEQLEAEYEEYEEEEEEQEEELELAEGEEYEEEEEGEEGEEEEEEEEEEEYELEEENPHEHLPRVVVVVDELADLMMVVGREVEESITRLAQKARAAGIHLILATQRPSVDVITGLIKANFPARISFQVTSRHDSKTILDGVGAERLLGMGDMLYMAPGTSFLARLHGAFISDREIDEVVEFIKEQGDPQYQMELLDSQSGDDEDEGEPDFFDELYDKAVDVVTRHGQGSTSWVQRQLGVGYNRAARIMEQMERDGVVGPADGSRPRQVLAQAIPPA